MDDTGASNGFVTGLSVDMLQVLLTFKNCLDTQTNRMLPLFATQIWLMRVTADIDIS